MTRFIAACVELLVFSSVMVVCTAAIVFAIRPELLAAVLVYLSVVIA